MAIPIINLTIIYILGIILSSFISISGSWLSVFLVFLVLLIVFCYYKEGRFITSILIYIGFFIIGVESYQLATITDTKNHVVNYIGKNLVIRGIIADDPTEEGKKVFALFKPEKIVVKDIVIKDIKGKIGLIVDKNLPNSRLKYGQKLEITCKLDKVAGKGNLQVQEHYYTQNIYGIVRIKKNFQIKVIDENGGNFLVKISYDIKRNFINSIENTLKAPSKFILQGILLGDKKIVPYEIRELFQETGIVHILAVSGLHVGLISLFFLTFAKKILCFSEKYAYIFTLVFVGIYALITGLKPSVMRASLMIASLIIAPLFYRRSSSINNLFLAALILLVFNPKMIYNLGFQFSFIATLGILMIVPILGKFSKNKWLKGVIAISGVSLAAWLFILPVLLYHFHKVSLIALVLNILVVPLVGIIVWCGFITYLLFNLNAYLAMIVGFVNQFIIGILLFLVEVVANIPYSVIYVSKVNMFFVVLYYGLILGLIVYMKNIIARRVDLPEVT